MQSLFNNNIYDTEIKSLYDLINIFPQLKSLIVQIIMIYYKKN